MPAAAARAGRKIVGGRGRQPHGTKRWVSATLTTSCGDLKEIKDIECSTTKHLARLLHYSLLRNCFPRASQTSLKTRY